MLRRKKKKNNTNASDQLSNVQNINQQNATDAAIDGMELLKWKADRVSKVGFEQSKGNLFEYIENAKLNRNLAEAGVSLDRISLTDVPLSKGGFGENTAPDDFRLIKNGEIVSRVQAKFNNNPTRAAQNFVNEKYYEMQRLAPSDQIPAIREQLTDMYNKGQISSKAYSDAIKELKENGLEDPVSGICSGGTTTEEILSLKGNDEKVSIEAVESYANLFELKQYANEVSSAALKGATTGAIFNGLISSVENTLQVFNDEKDIKDAVSNVLYDTGKGAIRGGAVASTAAALRIMGKKSGVAVLSDSAASTALAGGLIDCGVTLFEYANGEITKDELVYELNSNVVKTTSVIYIAKSLSLALGTFSPLSSMIVYTIAGYVISSTQAIIQNANLSAEAYRRMEEIYNESAYQASIYREKLDDEMKAYNEQNRKTMRSLLDTFEKNMTESFDYDALVSGMLEFASLQGMEIKNATYDSFCEAMNNDDCFIL